MEKLLKTEKYKMIYCVGPEPMMKAVALKSDEVNIDCQVSLESYMKCGFGICGQCVADPSGIRICKEGPVMSKEMFRKIFESGNKHRDAYGRKV